MARFTRRARVRSPRDYSAAFEGGKRLREALFDFVLLQRPAAPARLGLAVSKKVSPLATQRNRLKRQIRESFRANAARLPCADIIVIPRVASAKADNVALRRELERLWLRVNERCPKS
jgi:ribonuclease P protein component